MANEIVNNYAANNAGTSSFRRGIKIITKSVYITQLKITTYSHVSNATKAYLYLDVGTGYNGGTLLQTQDITSSTATFVYDFLPNTSYLIVVDADGATYNFAYYDGTINAIQGTSLSIVSGAASGSESTTQIYQIGSLYSTYSFYTNPINVAGTSGTRYIKNSYPPIYMTPINLIPQKSFISQPEKVGL